MHYFVRKQEKLRITHSCAAPLCKRAKLESALRIKHYALRIIMHYALSILAPLRSASEQSSSPHYALLCIKHSCAAPLCKRASSSPHYALRITHYALCITHYALRITHYYALRITHYYALRIILYLLQNRSLHPWWRLRYDTHHRVRGGGQA